METKTNMTEKEKMLAGEVYDATDPELLRELAETRERIYDYNALRPSETEKMRAILKELLGGIGDDEIIINQPFRCDYGRQISVGKRFFANFNFTVLDEARVTIGDDCFIGPNVSIGAGSVVVHDIPSNTVAAGNPCKVIKTL